MRGVHGCPCSHNRPARAASRSGHVQADPGPLLAKALAPSAPPIRACWPRRDGSAQGRTPVACAAKADGFTDRHGSRGAASATCGDVRGLGSATTSVPRMSHVVKIGIQKSWTVSLGICTTRAVAWPYPRDGLSASDRERPATPMEVVYEMTTSRAWPAPAAVAAEARAPLS